MLFVEFRFLAFFALVWLVHLLLPGHRSRKIWLLLCSYAFYAAWDWRFLGLIWLSTAVDFAVGIRLGRSTAQGEKTALLATSLCVNLGLLGFFKYCNFFLESLTTLLQSLGAQGDLGTLSIILPVGISFYTFQTLSYTIDVYRGNLEPTRDLPDFALFVGFFPQLVAGPIVRAADFLPQLLVQRGLNEIEVRRLLVLFLVGFAKKACVADNLAPFVDQYYATPEAFDAASAWVATLFYAVQIYCDFSGYSDMAIALAGLLGYSLCLNFDHPYFATNMTDFWRRWHISLSSWLRDYLYIPCGGGRGSRLQTYRNLMITMLLGGLWHGAAWTFVVWGGLHGAALVIHREWARLKTSLGLAAETRASRWLAAAAGTTLTFLWVCIAWVFFRSPDLATATGVVRTLVRFDGGAAESLGAGLILLMIPLAVLHQLARMEGVRTIWKRATTPVFAAAYGVAWSLALFFAQSSYAPFIYFQF